MCVLVKAGVSKVASIVCVLVKDGVSKVASIVCVLVKDGVSKVTSIVCVLVKDGVSGHLVSTSSQLLVFYSCHKHTQVYILTASVIKSAALMFWWYTQYTMSRSVCVRYRLQLSFHTIRFVKTVLILIKF